MKRTLLLAMAAAMSLSLGAGVAYAGGGGGGNGGQHVVDANSAPPGFFAGNPRYDTGGWGVISRSNLGHPSSVASQSSSVHNQSQNSTAG